MRNYTLPRRRMLKKSSSFQRVYRAGKSYANRYLVLYVFHVREGDPKRPRGEVGFAAGKKLGCAVIRSRVKRLLRESYRLTRPELKENVALILVGRRQTVRAKRQEVERAFRALAKKAGILREEK